MMVSAGDGDMVARCGEHVYDKGCQERYFRKLQILFKKQGYCTSADIQNESIIDTAT